MAASASAKEFSVVASGNSCMCEKNASALPTSLRKQSSSGT
jgi:hypothetical protein